MHYLNEYLESLGVELWPGEAFYLTDPKGREQATTWLQEFKRGYYWWEAQKYPAMYQIGL